MNHDLDRLIHAAIQAEIDEAIPPTHLRQTMPRQRRTETARSSWSWYVVSGVLEGGLVGAALTALSAASTAVAVLVATAFTAMSLLVTLIAVRVFLHDGPACDFVRDTSARRLREDRQRPSYTDAQSSGATVADGVRRRASSTGDAASGAVPASGPGSGADRASADPLSAIGLCMIGWRRALLRRGDPPRDGEP